VSDPEYKNLSDFLESSPTLPDGITREDLLNPENPEKVF
jgi:hypothetical protein